VIQILDHALKFVHEREHPEGGFTLYEGIPDTKNTYYGIKILQLLSEEPYNKENTIKWIENLQEGRQYSTRGIFYRLNILDVYKRNPKFAQKYVERFIERYKTSNPEIIFLMTSILRIVGFEDTELTELIKKYVLSFQNDDGGFGKYRSDIMSTYYALETLKLINHDFINSKEKIIDFTENCQTDEGIFAYTSLSYPPYIESIYAGIRIYEILEHPLEQGLNQDEIINFVLKLQNADGGFRRSYFIGISELEYVYRALYVLKSLNYYEFSL
jgi:hypothetical protein